MENYNENKDILPTTPTKHKKKLFNGLGTYKQKITFVTGVFIVLMVVLTTVLHGAIDPEALNFYEWLSRTSFLVMLAVAGMILGESSGSDKQKNNANGLYQISLISFNKLIVMLQPINIYFSQFLSWFSKNELHEKKVKFLMQIGNLENADNILKYVKAEDLPQLMIHAMTFEDKDTHEKIYIDQVTEEQKAVIQYVLNGGVSIDCRSSGYYLSATDSQDGGSILEQDKIHIENITNIQKWGRFLRIVAVIFFSLFWSMVTVKDLMKGDDLSAWLDLLSRMSVFVTCIWSGYSISCSVVREKAYIIQNKYKVLITFKESYETKAFVPYNAEELAKKHYEEYEAKQEEAKKNVVIPEVISVEKRILTLESFKNKGEINNG